MDHFTSKIHASRPLACRGEAEGVNVVISGNNERGLLPLRLVGASRSWHWGNALIDKAMGLDNFPYQGSKARIARKERVNILKLIHGNYVIK